MFKFVFKISVLFVLFAPFSVIAQTKGEFGPNVTAYLDYLKQELTVTDLRESQREVSKTYISHNFNRVSALRQFAIKYARSSQSDFMPELEAITQKEFHTLFPQQQPKTADLETDAIYNSVYRYLGNSKNVETFYIFARLNPFEEQAVRESVQNKGVTASKPKKTIILIKAQNISDAKENEKTATQTEPEKPKLSREQFLLKETSPKSDLKPQKP